MGWYDPEQHANSLDPLYGGNVPYAIDGLWVTDRLSPEYRSFCSVSVPDYIGVRLTGCAAGTSTSLLDTAMTLSVQRQGPNRDLVARLHLLDDSTAGIADRTIDFFVDGALLGSATTDGGGVATIALPKLKGRHTFEARFAGDSQYESAIATADG
jgi:hypothetical protein